MATPPSASSIASSVAPSVAVPVTATSPVAESGLSGGTPRSTDPGDYQRIGPPVAAMAKEFADGFWVRPHSHLRAQLVYGTEGVMRVTAAGSTWVVPPGRAVWIPAGIPHELRMAGRVMMRTLYIDSQVAQSVAEQCRVIEVSALLRELILGVLAEPVDYAPASRADLMSRLILSELQQAPSVPVHLPLPQDARLKKICRYLLAHPHASDSIEQWGTHVGASSRTLARRFRAETGMGFVEWRQRARIAEAVCRLASGQPVKRIAADLGYQSTSAFIAMFRRTLGSSPQRYAQRCTTTDSAIRMPLSPAL